MKKIGIVTLPGNFNYGNRLQNYALQQVLVSLNNNVQNIVLPTKKRRRQVTLKLIISNILTRLSTENRQYHKMMEKKIPILTPFTDKYLKSQEFKFSNISSFDAFFVGSDQVWNPDYIGNDSRYFLDFVPREKRFSYAASFGLSKIPDQFRRSYRQSLEEMNKISVRETQGLDIINSISNVSATLVADPTLLLTQNQWDQLANNSGFISDQEYILVYILGDFVQENNDKIIKYAKNKNAKIITIMGDRYNPDYWIPNPLEFLAAIRGALAVFTDSFHCTVFSIIFKIPFIVFDRSDTQMVSRIDTLLSCFNFEDNKFSPKTNIDKVLSEMVVSETTQILNRERINGTNFIKACLEDVD